MRTAALFKNGNNQAVRLPKEFEFTGVTEVEITKEGGAVILTPRRKSWTSFSEVGKADADFLCDRPDMLDDGRVVLCKNWGQMKLTKFLAVIWVSPSSPASPVGCIAAQSHP